MTARGVTIQLDVPRQLRFDGVALIRLEEITGMNVLAVCQEFKTDDDESKGKKPEKKIEEQAASFSFRLICQIAQAGLVGELPHATTDDIARLMDEHGKGDGPFGRILYYAQDVFAAFSESIGADAKNVKADLEKAKEEIQVGEKIPTNPKETAGAGMSSND